MSSLFSGKNKKSQNNPTPMRCWVKTRKNRFRAPQKKGGKTELMTRLIGFCATKRREMAPSNTKGGSCLVYTHNYIYIVMTPQANAEPAVVTSSLVVTSRDVDDVTTWC